MLWEVVILIVVKISTDGIEINGHAEYAEFGKDIVCSAVTVLVFNLLNSIEALTSDIVKYQADDPGHINIRFKNLSERGKLLVDSFFIGISEIRRAYPEHVQIN